MQDIVEPVLLAEFDLDFTAISSNWNELGMDPGQLLISASAFSASGASTCTTLTTTTS